MPAKRRVDKRRSDLHPEAIEWLQGGSGGAWAYLLSSEDMRAALWREHSAEIVAEYAAEHPGRRPGRWWEFDAPEPRQRVGGVGTPAHERLAYVPRFRHGVPTRWLTDEDAKTFGPLGKPAVDCDNPPRFESEAAYLNRLKLLLPGERKRIKARDFAPETVIGLGLVELADSLDA